jgi:hypothetical protein
MTISVVLPTPSLSSHFSFFSLTLPLSSSFFFLLLIPSFSPSHPLTLHLFLLLVPHMTVLDQQMDLSEGEASTSMMMRDYCIAEKKAGKITATITSYFLYSTISFHTMFLFYSIPFTFIFHVNK